MGIIVSPNVRTDRLGGVDIPTSDTLEQMHASQYILHAAAGHLTQLSVDKVLLPHSNKMSPQAVTVDRGADGVVYVQQVENLCKSTDGGRTWTARSIEYIEGDPGFRWKVLAGGTFISVR